MNKIARVLIVDDEDSFHKEMEFSFGKEFELLHVSSIDEAKSLITNDKEIDLFVVDLNLDSSEEDLTGLKFISFLENELPKTARIAVTSMKGSNISKLAKNTGANEYLYKGDFDLFKWKNVLNGCISRRNASLSF